MYIYIYIHTCILYIYIYIYTHITYICVYIYIYAAFLALGSTSGTFTLRPFSYLNMFVFRLPEPRFRTKIHIEIVLKTSRDYLPYGQTPYYDTPY